MKLKRLFVALLIPFMWACDGLPGRPDPANRYIRPENVTDFGRLYQENCSGCHGADGRLGPAIPVGDSIYLALAKTEYIEAITSKGINGTSMPAFALSEGGTLTDKQITIIAKGMKTRWGKTGQFAAGAKLPPLSVEENTKEGNASRGKKTFEVFCGDCHGADGRGTPKAGSVVEPPYLALVSDQNLRTITIIGRRDLGMPDWQTAGKRPMTNQEITDVVAWLSAQRPERPSKRNAH